VCARAKCCASHFFEQGRKFVSECVPKNFAYFHVEFGLSSGFIHVIDDEQEFPRTFGADVVAGVLEIPGEVVARLKRKPAQEVIDDSQLISTAAQVFCRSGLLWTCSVQRSMNSTGRSPFELEIVNNNVALHG
jgi:hypothetical protein